MSAITRPLRSRHCSIALGCAILLAASSCTPRIATFNPPQGPPGTLVTIEGENFGATVSENTVKFRGVVVPPADVLSASKTKIQAKVPATAKTGLISVTTSKGTGTSSQNFVIPELSKWTFMVYLDADNNLEAAGLDDFREMSSVGSSQGLNIVVEMDRAPGYTTADGDWTSTRRFLIKKGDTPAVAPLQDLGEQNMGDPAVLQSFVEWAATNYPAEHYALVIWNHGSGWRVLLERLNQKVMAARSRSDADWGISRAVASDETNNDELYMREVQTALESAKASLQERLGTQVKLDVLGFDACLMGMAEVAYAVRNIANYMVGSEETEPADGWPYNTILTDLAANLSLPPKDLASVIVTRYGESYSSGVTQAAVDIAAVDNLAVKIDAFSQIATLEWDKLKAARLATRQYHPSWSPSIWGTDLWDFADRVNNGVSSPNIKTAANDIKAAINSFVFKEHHSGNMAGSHGVALYFPPAKAEFNNDPEHTGYQDANTYMPVDFVRYHQWDNWLTTYYGNIP